MGADDPHQARLALHDRASRRHYRKHLLPRRLGRQARRGSLLHGKVALVTGGAKRVGKAVVTALAERGCKVVVHYRTSQAAAEETVRELLAAGREALAIQADITQEADVERMIDTAVARFGRIDVLVNNAAVFFRTPVDTLTVEEWEQVMDVNLTGTFLCAQKLGLRMRDWGWGHIINMADVAGLRPWADYIPYSGSKA